MTNNTISSDTVTATSPFADQQYGFSSDYKLGLPAGVAASETETYSVAANVDMAIIAVFKPAP